MTKFRKAIRHPFYYLSAFFPFFSFLVSKYHKEYGLDTQDEEMLKKVIYKNTDKNSQLVLVCPNKKICDSIKNKKYKNVTVYDFNRLHLADCENDLFSFKLISSLASIKAGDNNVLVNVLNSLDREQKVAFLSSLDAEKRYIFYGRICRQAYKKPLGPEPIGSFGCAEYNTDGLETLLKKHFKMVEFVLINDYYLANCS